MPMNEPLSSLQETTAESTAQRLRTDRHDESQHRPLPVRHNEAHFLDQHMVEEFLHFRSNELRQVVRESFVVVFQEALECYCMKLWPNYP